MSLNNKTQPFDKIKITVDTSSLYWPDASSGFYDWEGIMDNDNTFLFLIQFKINKTLNGDNAYENCHKYRI